jgi:hypothetical protein
MNRKKISRMAWMACAAAAALTACGSSDDGAGNGAAGGVNGVTGTVDGVAFSAREAISAVIAPQNCTVSGVSGSVAGLVIGLSNFTGTCAVAGNACNGKANAQGVVLVIGNLALLGTASPVGPGTYTVSPVGVPISTPVAFAALGRTDASCTDLAGVPEVRSGTVTITSVSVGAASGSVSLTFADGSTLSGPFSATGCAGFQVDPCTGTVSGFNGGTCTGTRACLP